MRVAVALVVVTTVVGVAAPAAGAGGHPRPTFWTSIEWPRVVGVTPPRCVSDSVKATAYQSDVWGEPIQATKVS